MGALARTERVAERSGWRHRRTDQGGTGAPLTREIADIRTTGTCSPKSSSRSSHRCLTGIRRVHGF